jgi:hypothetical protein
MGRFGLSSYAAVALVASVARADPDPLSAIAHAAPRCDASRAHCFGLNLHVAVDDHGSVASAEWVATQLTTANRDFEALDVGFELARLDALPDSDAHVESRRHRDLLGRAVHGAQIDVFVVDQLDDIDRDGIIYGVTWRSPRTDHKFLVISARAWQRTLAHELGHFFGLPHSTQAGSLMNTAQAADTPVDQQVFTENEVAAMRPAIARMIRERIVVERPRQARSEHEGIVE